jgi:EAL domain-containing protein (putative c-di-GMP-specific phosphodiesterase class I)
MGIDFVQGYHIGRPLPAEKIIVKNISPNNNQSKTK